MNTLFMTLAQQADKSGWDRFVQNLYTVFIKDDRWKFFLEGLGNTLLITVVALIVGVVIGALVAAIKSSHDTIAKPHILLRIANKICDFYLTIIRGTPMTIQLMICYFVIFNSTIPKIAIAWIAFGVNSGAYVAEIFRSGISSIDKGQTEAGRSLGFNYLQTMYYIIMPQAIKNILPALGNEFIVLIKETSIAGFISLMDLTRASDIVIGLSFDAVIPLLTVAIVYLLLVMGLSKLLKMFERRLKNSDH